MLENDLVIICNLSFFTYFMSQGHTLWCLGDLVVPEIEPGHLGARHAPHL